MTVDSELFMPKSKAPKMDELDYSEWTLTVGEAKVASCVALVGVIQLVLNT